MTDTAETEVEAANATGHTATKGENAQEIDMETDGLGRNEKKASITRHAVRVAL